MKILVLVYEGFAEFEMTLLGYVAREERNEVVTAAPDDTPQVRGMGGLLATADLRLSQVNVAEYAALVIPGGTPESLIDREEVSALIRRFHDAGKLVVAICMGPVHLAKAGVLAGRAFTTSSSQNYRDLFDWPRKVDNPVVVDGNIITAQGEAFVNFTFTVMERLEAYQDMADAPRWRREFGAWQDGVVSKD
ncbi:MAG: DJ-1/PfpI family protein [Firmicutes bacterium]|nr:DJ-1/PfpI family protein [Bacillota bacterium]